MSTSNRNILKIFKRYRDGNLIERIRIFTKYLVRRSSFIQNSALLLGLIFKNIKESEKVIRG